MMARKNVLSNNFSGFILYKRLNKNLALYGQPNTLQQPSPLTHVKNKPL